MNTLYRHFPNKSAVLDAAIVDRFRSLYVDILKDRFDHGMDRICHIVDSVAGYSAHFGQYAKSLGPKLVSHYFIWSLGEIRFDTYLPALMQIQDAGELGEDVDVRLLTALVCRQITSVYLSWSYGELAADVIPDISKLMVALTLSGVSSGYTANRCAEIIKAQMNRHAGRVFY